jgi:hypothetical protein
VAALLEAGTNTSSFAAFAQANSIYDLYNDVIASTTIDNYLNNGVKMYNALASEIGAVNTLSTTVKSLSSWYSDVQATIAKTPKSLTAKDYETFTGDPTQYAPNYYKDTSTGNALYQQFLDLISQSASDAVATASSSTSITSLKGEFAQLVSQSTSTSSSFNKALGSLNSLVKTDGKQSKANSQYSQNFSGVMKNARNGSTDNQNVYDFLSNPLTVAKQSTAQSSSFSIPWQWIIPLFLLLLLLVSVVINLTMVVKRKFSKKDEAQSGQSAAAQAAFTDDFFGHLE